MARTNAAISQVLSLLAALMVAILPASAFAQGGKKGSVVCPEDDIVGFEKAHIRGSKVLPASTHDSDDQAAYVSMQDGVIFFQSNQLVPGQSKNVWKIATNEISDLKTLLLNVLPESDQTEARVDKLHKTTKYILDSSVFKADSTTSLDLEGAENVWIVNADSTVPHRALRVEKARGPPRWYSAWKEHVYIPASTSQSAIATLENLAKTKLDPSAMRFASLVEDSATDSVIAKADRLSKVLFKPPPRSMAEVKRLFAGAKGLTIAVMGHIEGTDLVTRGARGEELFRIPVADVQAEAESQGCRLILLGCNSARMAGIGVADRFNSVDAVSRLATSLERPTFGGVLDSLSSANFRLVLDKAYVEGEAQGADFSIEASRPNSPSDFGEVGKLKLYRSKADQATESPRP